MKLTTASEQTASNQHITSIFTIHHNCLTDLNKESGLLLVLVAYLVTVPFFIALGN